MHTLSLEDSFRLRYTKDAKLVGKYQFAQLDPIYHSLPSEVKCFNERSSIKGMLDCGLHCFISDALFECLWSNCDRYVTLLKQIPVFIGTDFSVYRDMEEWRRIYNCGRNYAIAYYLTSHGVNVVPVATWAFLSDLDWSLDGFQKGCTLAVSNNGCLRDPSSRRIFTSGIEIIQQKLNPKMIYICGKHIPELDHYKDIRYFPNYSERKFKKEK
jgi:hypothetical protein